VKCYYNWKNQNEANTGKWQINWKSFHHLHMLMFSQIIYKLSTTTCSKKFSINILSTTVLRTRNSSRDENTWTLCDVYCVICLLTYAYRQIATEPEPVPLCIKWIVCKLTLFNCTHSNLNFTSQNIAVHWCVDCEYLLDLIYTIYWVTSYLQLLALSILTCSPNKS